MYLRIPKIRDQPEYTIKRMSMIPKPGFIILIGCLLLSAGCTQPFGAGNQTTAGQTAVLSPSATYRATIAQPEESAALIHMDTDIYNIGEVVELTVTNDKNYDLTCTNNPPSFSVRYQKGNGQWVTRMGTDNPPPGNESRLRPGESTETYRFVTTGWDPGRYRIISDCGVSREILIRPVPSLTPTPPVCPPATNTSPWIRITPFSDQYANNPFTIAGTTSLPAGDKLQYAIFSLGPDGTATPEKLISSSTDISPGSCGTNTWYVEGEVQVPGIYFIGISDSANTISAVKRFAIMPSAPVPGTGTLLPTPAPPGITTGRSG